MNFEICVCKVDHVFWNNSDDLQFAGMASHADIDLLLFAVLRNLSLII